MPSDPTDYGYDAERWMRSLKAMSAALGETGPPVHLCLIGSAVCMFSGMEACRSFDLDIWRPASAFDWAELEAAAKGAGLLFNPKDVLEPEKPYLKLVSSGIVQVGKFEPVNIETIGRLELYRPPFENIIASKLARAAEKDIHDIHYLARTFQPDITRVREIIASFPPASRSLAEENLIYLEAAG